MRAARCRGGDSNRAVANLKQANDGQVIDRANGKPTAYFSYTATVVSTGSFQYMSTRNNNFSNR